MPRSRPLTSTTTRSSALRTASATSSATLTRTQGRGLALSSEQDLAPLQGMTKLRRLDLTGCAITDAAVSSALASLWHIQTFIACSNALSDLGPFAKLHTLTDLDLSGNRSIVSIEPLRGLVAMKKICLSLCAIESLGPLQGMRDLHQDTCFELVWYTSPDVCFAAWPTCMGAIVVLL